MGMFDAFILEVRCPSCGNIIEVDFQTKMFSCSMNRWKKGDRFDGGDIVIYDGIIKNIRGHTICCHVIYADILIRDGLVYSAVNVRIPTKEDC